MLCGRLELRTAGTKHAESLVQAGPGPRLDFAVPGYGLITSRLEVLEPCVRLLDLEQLLGLADRPHESVVVIVHATAIVGPGSDDPMPTLYARTGRGHGYG
jgi:hypothetical protein